MQSAHFVFFYVRKLPFCVRNTYKNNWRPVLKIMEEAIVSGASKPREMTVNEVTEWYEAGTHLLRVRASYIFAKPRSYLWGVATWSKHVRPSNIRKFGTADDVLAISPPTHSWGTKPRTYGKRKRRTVCLAPKHT